MELTKKLRKLFFYREYVRNTYVAHHVHYTMVVKKILWFKIAYIRHFGYDLTVFATETAAKAFIKEEKAKYREALKYLYK